MSTVVFSSPVVAGHQSLVTNGAYTSYTMSISSGAFPSSGYRITAVTLKCTLRNASWDTITVKAGGTTLGSFESGGISGERTCSLSTSYAYANLSTLTLYGGGIGTQIAGGSYVTVTVTWSYTASKLSLSASSVKAGGSVTANITCSDPSFTHQVVLKFGSRSQTWNVSAGTSNCTVTVPIAWLDQISDVSSGIATVTLKTLSSGTNVGTASKSLTVTVPSSASPTFTSACTPLLTVAGTTYPSMGGGVYVQNKSGFTATISSAVGQYGATIQSYSIRGAGYSGTALTLNSGLIGTSGAVTVTFTVMDSRGLSTKQTIQLTVLAYAPPTVTFSGWRVDATGATDALGILGKCKAVWSFTSLNGANTCSAAGTVAPKGGTATAMAAALASGTAYDVATSSGAVTLLQTTAYTLKITLTDAYGSVSIEAEIPSANFALYFSSDGTSVAFGMATSKTNAVEISPTRDLWYKGKELRDLLYPIGAVYLSTASTSPAAIYGGTWEQITDRFLLAAGSTYTAGATGGAASVTLTEEQLPKISGSLLTGYGNNGATAGGFGPLRSASGCLSVAQERQYTGPSTGTAIALSGNYAQLKMDIGGGQSVSTMPPYLAVYVWQRLA